MPLFDRAFLGDTALRYEIGNHSRYNGRVHVLTWRRGGGWSYRRTVPKPLRAFVGRREIWVALGTASRRAALNRAVHLQPAVEEVFSAAWSVKEGKLQVAPAELEGLSAEGRAEYERIMGLNDPSQIMEEMRSLDEQVWAIAAGNAALMRDATAAAARATRLKNAMQRLQDVTSALNEVRNAADRLSALHDVAHEVRGRLAEAREQRTENSKLTEHLLSALAAQRSLPTAAVPVAVSTTKAAESAECFASSVEKFVVIKGEGWTAQTMHQNRATYRLWTELVPDMPVAEVTKQHAGTFVDLLLKLPASHGKGNPNVSPRMAIERADARAEPVRRLSVKTVKRHLSAMSQLWAWLESRGLVPTNVFRGHPLPSSRKGKSKKRRRDAWGDEQVVKLLGAPWTRRKIPSQSYRWLVLVAMYTGMRVEEIARLRPQYDFDVIEGVPVLVIQDHPDGWTPKTEAGERVIPVHPTLITLGFLDLVERRKLAGATRVIDGLVPGGPDRKLAADFSREFSRHKQRLEFGEKTTFHSFRHSVITKLRNTPKEIRSEWIDALMGHEDAQGEKRSEGAVTYFKAVGASNMRKTISALKWSPEVNKAVWNFVSAAAGASETELLGAGRRSPRARLSARCRFAKT